MTIHTKIEADWSRRLNAYKQPDLVRSVGEIAVTLAPLVLIWGLAYAALGKGWWPVALLLDIAAAGFLLRVFMIQHDCGHYAFFRSRPLSDWVGRLLGVLTLTPYEYWRHTHALHHSTSGDLDRRGLGAVDTLTVDEYLSLSPGKRLGYRLYRHPAVMFGVGPLYLFFFQQRVPFGLFGSGKLWLSTLGTSAGAAVLFAGLVWAFGWSGLILVHCASVLLAATIGIWLFYVQHQFDDSIWLRKGVWRPQEAALLASSHYDLGPVLNWLTAYIGIHHVHHLSSRIPFYRLPEILREHPELDAMSRIGVRESFGFARLALWDEAQHRLVAFRDLRSPA